MQYSIGDVLVLLDKTLLNPLVSILLSLFLHFQAENKFITSPSVGWFSSSIATPMSPALYRSLILVSVGLILRVNRFLSQRALNNGVSSKFHWKQEIVVVTGASGGIGAQAVHKLAARGSKVIVLDVIPLTYEKRKLRLSRLS